MLTLFDLDDQIRDGSTSGEKACFRVAVPQRKGQGTIPARFFGPATYTWYDSRATKF